MSKDDFELPPLPQASDIPMTLSDIDFEVREGKKEADLEDVKAVAITDMDNAPVNAAPKTDFKSANRRKHMAQDRANDIYLEKLRPKREKVSIFRVRCEQGKELEEIGRKHANRLLIALMVFSVLSVLMALSIKSIVLLVFETVIALFFVRGNVLGRIGYICACVSNILLNIIAIAEKLVYSIDKASGMVVAEYTGSVPAAVIPGLLVPVFIMLLLYAIFDNSVVYFCRDEKISDDETE
ncbi:MAG: hypothetical protein ACI4Q6_05905 [Huintestinicola sp.]